MIKFWISIFCFLLVFPGISAHADIWQPSAEYKQVPIWPKRKMPDALPNTKPEYLTKMNNLVAGKPWYAIWEVSQPVNSPSKDTSQEIQQVSQTARTQVGYFVRHAGKLEMMFWRYPSDNI